MSDRDSCESNGPDYTEFPQFEQIRAFLVDGPPFRNLKNNLRDFVNTNSVNEFVAGNFYISTSETAPYLILIENMQHGIIIMVLGILWIIALFDAILIHQQRQILRLQQSLVLSCNQTFNKRFTSSPLSSRTIRLEWICHCGHVSYDDLMDLPPGSVDAIADELREFGDSWRNLGISVLRFCTSLALSTERAILPMTEHAIDTQLLATVIDPLWVLFCINGSEIATLQHLDLCTTKSDLELFTNLKTAYLSLRSQVALVRRLFLRLSKIHFVQFQLLPRSCVDCFEIGSMPPPDRVDYVYKVVPSKPPVPPKYMLHVYKHPENGSGTTFCFDRFPKKKNERLHFETDGDVVGWGIYFTESLHLPMFVTAFFLFTVLTGLVFGICWTVMENDISGAWAVASWIFSVCALGISA
ncbi:hypothetical protein VTL71DRAFT_15356 [Oculimacula yallundae]|uniref:Uncharacterized protein n=1 Tax=Oculimacula yallundae TaxID=86028 RepID=A0ABR4CGD1_9HELO